MKVLPLSEVKNNLSKLVEQLRTTHEEITVTRNGHAAAIIMSPEEFEPPNRNVTIFPEKIGGRYAALHRPMPEGLGQH